MSTSPQLIMKSTRLAVVQLGRIGADKQHNLAHARNEVLRATREGPLRGADMVILPECFNSPYGVDHFEHYAESLSGLYDALKTRGGTAVAEGGARAWPIDNKDEEHPVTLTPNVLERSESLRMLSDVAKEAGIVLVGGSIPERDDKTGCLFNTSVVFDKQGRAIGIHRKLHLFNIDIPGKMTFQESKTLAAGDAITLFDCEYGRFGLGICYDMRFPEPALISARLGACAMLYPAAFNTTTGPVAWELLLRSRALDNQLYTVGCSPARPTEGYPAWGHSTVVNPLGTVIETCDEKETIIWAELDPACAQDVRKTVPVSSQRRFDVYGDIAK
ncbi:omega-amidase [Malassezia vespertilionis]|uniref:CN hydrolase domain-containing protein n=1 Tax=Malassezia vespertilionis TaxID=2020962 RepID=A0A2N1JHM6_9BASI|nr:omega-amidase [Malassezia vespertilionis]PKI86035.1 hypothetical protein MVES_000145 [Malassezia vespertilionis]WFD04822.1 omega-amidase [Malassezia vespertilionis]